MLINFPYIQRDTPIHRLDPRAKFLLLLAYGIVAALTTNFWFILIGLIVSAWYYSLARLTWRETRGVWLVIIIFNLMLVFFNYFLSGGAVVQGIDLSHQHVLFTIPFFGFKNTPPFVGPAPLVFSIESIVFLITQAMRNFSIALLAIPIPFTTEPSVMGATFKGMGLPDKIAYAIDLSFRFLPTVARDFRTSLDAQRARGFEVDKLRGGIFGKIAKLAPMIVPVVIGSVVGAEDIISAMELRCFGLGKRTWFVQLHPRRFDRILLALIPLGFVLCLTWSILGNYYSSGILHVLHTQGIPQFLAP